MTQPRQSSRRNQNAKPDPHRLLTVRAALLLGFAVIIALGAGWLLLATHRPIATTVLSSVAVFAAALKLLNDLVE